MNRDMDTLVGRISPVSDDEAARMVGDAGDLARRIAATPPENVADVARVARPRRRRWLVGVPVAVGLTGAAFAVTAIVQPGGDGPMQVGPPRAEAAALSFEKKGGHIEVRVRDPLADPRRYRREFAAHGLKINLTMVPASPSIVGTVVFSDESAGPDQGKITTITAKGECTTGGGGDSCPVGVKVPADYRGTATVVFGRAARPGERYKSAAPVTAPGEAMHGLDFRNHTVDEVLAILEKRGVTVPEYRHVSVTGGNGRAGEDPGGHQGRPAVEMGRSEAMSPDEVPGDWYVHKGVPWAKDQVLLFVGPQPSR